MAQTLRSVRHVVTFDTAQRMVYGKARTLVVAALLAVLCGLPVPSAAQTGDGRFSFGGAAAPSSMLDMNHSAGTHWMTNSLGADQDADVTTMFSFSTSTDAVLGRPDRDGASPFVGLDGDADLALGLRYGARLSSDVSVTLAPGVRLRSDKAFTVDGDDDTALIDVGVGVALRWQLNPAFGITGTASAVRPLGQRGDTGPAQDAETEVFTGVFLGYRF